MRASLNLMPEIPIAEVVELARHAEALGFDRCWVYDEGLATRDVYVTLAAIAAATARMELGTGITNPFTRHPAATAAAIASLDELSGGRAFLGIGAGGSLTLGPLDVDRSRSLTDVRDTIVACRSLFSGTATTMTARRFTLRGARLDYARASLPIWLAGRGPKMLQLGGALADGVMLDFLHHDVIGDAVALVRRAGEEAGNQPKLCYATLVVTSDEAMQAAKPHLTYRLVDSTPRVRELIGITDGEVETIRAAMVEGVHAAGRHVRDEWVRPFVLFGTPVECATQLRRLQAEHGFDEFMLPVLEHATAGALLETVAAMLRSP